MSYTDEELNYIYDKDARVAHKVGRLEINL